MESKFVSLINGTLLNPFLLEESKEKEDMTLSDFVRYIGLRGIAKKTIEGKVHLVYEIVDSKKWLLSKIKYGI